MENAGLISHVIDVVGIKLDDTPGELAKISSILSANKISIEYIYGYGTSEGRGLLAMRATVEAEQVRKLLSDFEVY